MNTTLIAIAILLVFLPAREGEVCTARLHLAQVEPIQSTAEAPRLRRYEKTFPIGESPTLIVVNSSLRGSIKVQTWNRREIKVLAEIYSSTVTVDASKSGEIVTIKLRRHGRELVDIVNFDLLVPPECATKVSTVSGDITIENVQGRLKVFTTDGNITLTGVSCQNIEAISCMNGNIRLSGELVPQGRYSFYSGGGSIDVDLPESVSFTLYAATHQGRIDSEGFRFSSESRTPSHLEGVWGTGSSLLKLRTHSGSIRLRKR